MLTTRESIHLISFKEEQYNLRGDPKYLQCLGSTPSMIELIKKYNLKNLNKYELYDIVTEYPTHEVRRCILIFWFCALHDVEYLSSDPQFKRVY
jgi:hypothetical protein